MKKRVSNKEADAAWDAVQGKTPAQQPKKGSNLFNAMAQDAESIENEMPSGDKLKNLTISINKMIKLEQDIAALSEAMQKLADDYNVLRTATIPDIFDEIGMKKFSLVDGRKVEVIRDFAASITEENKPAAFSWLKKNGHEAIIKHEVTVKLKKGEKEVYDELRQDLALMGLDYADKEFVHPQTLKAFVKEQMTNRSDIPQDAFGVFPIRNTKIS